MNKIKYLILLLLLIPLMVKADMGGPMFDQTDAKVLKDNAKVYKWNYNGDYNGDYIETDIVLEKDKVITIVNEDNNGYARFYIDNNDYYILLTDIKYLPIDIDSYNLEKIDKYYTIKETKVYETTSLTSNCIGVIDEGKDIEAKQARLFNKRTNSYINYFYNWRYYESDDLKGWINVTNYSYDDENIVTVATYLEKPISIMFISNTPLYVNPINENISIYHDQYGEVITTNLSYIYFGKSRKTYYYYNSLWINSDDVALSTTDEFVVIDPNVEMFKSLNSNQKVYNVELNQGDIITSSFYTSKYIMFKFNNTDFWIKKDDNYRKIAYTYAGYNIDITSDTYYYSDGDLKNKIGTIKAGSYLAYNVSNINAKYYIQGYGYINSNYEYKPEDNYEYKDYYLRFEYDVPYYKTEELKDQVGTITENTVKTFQVALVKKLDDGSNLYYLKNYGYILSESDIDEFVFYEKNDWDYDRLEETNNDNTQIYIIAGTVVISLSALVSIVLIRKKQNKKKVTDIKEDDIVEETRMYDNEIDNSSSKEEVDESNTDNQEVDGNK